jgi:cbb3-type cytochrome oxidase subunit 3
MRLSDIMSAAGLSSWTEVALVVCFITFAAIVFWVFVVRSKPSYDHISQLPLDENVDAAKSLQGGDE